MKKINGECPEICALLGLVDTYIRHRQFLQKDDRSYKHYHPSEFGKCLRRQQYLHYTELGYLQVEKSSFESRILRLFDKGHNMHSRWTDYFDGMGILRGLWKCKNPFCMNIDDKGIVLDSSNLVSSYSKKNETRIYGKKNVMGEFKPDLCVCGCPDFEYVETPVISSEMNMKGRADAVLDFSGLKIGQFEGVEDSFDKSIFPKNPIVVDMKTINDYDFKNRLVKIGPHPEYVIQLTTYIHLLGCEFGVLLYENKNDSQIKSFKIPRNDKRFAIIKDQARMMVEMASGENKLLPPPRPSSRSCYECKKCEFSSVCLTSSVWKDDKLDEKRQKFYKGL